MKRRKSRNRSPGEKVRRRLLLLLLLLPIVSGAKVNIACGLQPSAYTQSSYYTEYKHTARNAANGNTNGTYSENNCVHTDTNDRQPWWLVDLGRPHYIFNIKIWGRTGQLRRNSALTITVDGTVCASTSEDGNLLNQTLTLNCTRPLHGQVVRITRNKTSSSDYFINFCEVEIFECSEGSYGIDCNRNCPRECSADGCYMNVGNCITCPPGKKGSSCEHECESGRYGNGCEQRCGHCIRSLPCDTVNGTCRFCKPGWKPYMCQTQCSDGWYGVNCMETCGGCLNNTACNKTNGHCQHCSAGKQPPYCKEECSDGWYGVDCRETCGGCLNNAACNKTNGHCQHCTACKQPPYCKEDAATDILYYISGGSASLIAVLLVVVVVLACKLQRAKQAAKSDIAAHSISVNGAHECVQQDRHQNLHAEEELGEDLYCNLTDDPASISCGSRQPEVSHTTSAATAAAVEATASASAMSDTVVGPSIFPSFDLASVFSARATRQARGAELETESIELSTRLYDSNSQYQNPTRLYEPLQFSSSDIYENCRRPDV